jgi:hypothetical protein
MPGPVFQRILAHRPYEVLLTSTDDGYTVRLSKALSNHERERMGGLTCEPVRLTHPPVDLACPSVETFYRTRIALRNELIGWIKAELSREAVVSLIGMPLLPGQRQPSISELDFRVAGQGPRDAWPEGTIVVEDDLSDLDHSRSLWRLPTDGDEWVRW